jgi:mannosyl-3-phosphoglycerate phosphatase family protein
MRRPAVFTAIDATLLDATTFDAGAALPVLRRLQELDVPVVPITVMTLDEIAPIAAELGMRHAMIIEAGGAIARWNGAAWDVEPCGPPADAMLDVIRAIEESSGANLLVYSALPASIAARVSGRTGAMLERSRQRNFSEPFIIERGDLADVERAAATIGFSIRRGRRFFHLCRESNEGEAFSRVRAELRCDVAIGAGSALIDGGFLARCDAAIIIPESGGGVDEDLAAMLPEARIAQLPAPDGWAVAIEAAMQSIFARQE